MYRDQSGEFVWAYWGLKVNDSNSCKLILFKSARVAGAKRGGEGKKNTKKKRERNISLTIHPPPCFSPLLKSTIPFDECHMLTRSPSKSVYNHHYVVTKYAKNTKCNKHRKIPFQRCHCQRHYFVSKNYISCLCCGSNLFCLNLIFFDFWYAS